ncbi:PilN domain-containing protein [Inediibacterium massiliense]|uniref:PilN domain-containing protein n=1 Tax=Inediibacterium massiliense TaxID=1658111 RepID=UPI0018FE1071|nr:PilN domain-containing protein [Inediibacterium massiliense]
MKKIRHQIQYVDKEISNLSYEEIKMIQKKKENMKKLKLRIDEFNDFKLYIKNKDMVNDCLLYTLKNMVPNNLFFQTIEMNSKEIKIQGFATTQIAIAQFEHNLEATNCFEEIFISNIENRGNYDFTLVFSIKEF